MNEVMLNNSDLPSYDEMWANVYGSAYPKYPVHRRVCRVASDILEPLDYESIYEGIIDAVCGHRGNHMMLSTGRSLMRFGGVEISAVTVNRAMKYTGGEFAQPLS